MVIAQHASTKNFTVLSNVSFWCHFVQNLWHVFTDLLITYKVFITANSVYIFPTQNRQPWWWQKTVKAGVKDGLKDVLLE